MDRGRKFCKRNACQGLRNESTALSADQRQPQPQPSQSLNANQQQQAPANGTAGNSTQILFVEPNFVETPSEYETFYDCFSDCELKRDSSAMSKVMTGLEDPDKFRGTLKKVVCTSHKLLKSFDEASKKQKKVKSGMLTSKECVQRSPTTHCATGPACNSTENPQTISFTIPVSVQLHYPGMVGSSPNPATLTTPLMEPIRTSIVAATRSPNPAAADQLGAESETGDSTKQLTKFHTLCPCKTAKAARRVENAPSETHSKSPGITEKSSDNITIWRKGHKSLPPKDGAAEWNPVMVHQLRSNNRNCCCEMAVVPPKPRFQNDESVPHTAAESQSEECSYLPPPKYSDAVEIREVRCACREPSTPAHKQTPKHRRREREVCVLEKSTCARPQTMSRTRVEASEPPPNYTNASETILKTGRCCPCPSGAGSQPTLSRYPESSQTQRRTSERSTCTRIDATEQTPEQIAPQSVPNDPDVVEVIPKAIDKCSCSHKIPTPLPARHVDAPEIESEPQPQQQQQPQENLTEKTCTFASPPKYSDAMEVASIPPQNSCCASGVSPQTQMAPTKPLETIEIEATPQTQSAQRPHKCLCGQKPHDPPPPSPATGPQPQEEHPPQRAPTDLTAQRPHKCSCGEKAHDPPPPSLATEPQPQDQQPPQRPPTDLTAQRPHKCCCHQEADATSPQRAPIELETQASQPQSAQRPHKCACGQKSHDPPPPSPPKEPIPQEQPQRAPIDLSAQRLHKCSCGPKAHDPPPSSPATEPKPQEEQPPRQAPTELTAQKAHKCSCGQKAHDPPTPSPATKPKPQKEQPPQRAPTAHDPPPPSGAKEPEQPQQAPAVEELEASAISRSLGEYSQNLLAPSNRSEESYRYLRDAVSNSYYSVIDSLHSAREPRFQPAESASQLNWIRTPEVPQTESEACVCDEPPVQNVMDEPEPVQKSQKEEPENECVCAETKSKEPACECEKIEIPQTSPLPALTECPCTAPPPECPCLAEDRDLENKLEEIICQCTKPTPPPKPKRHTYSLASPQHKELHLCTPCRYDPSPLVDEDGRIFCPMSCGCCLCPWKPRATESLEDRLKHQKIKVCKCRERGNIFEKFTRKDVGCSNDSFFDVCPCREKAEARFLEIYGYEMWTVDDKLSDQPKAKRVTLDEINEIKPRRKSVKIAPS